MIHDIYLDDPDPARRLPSDLRHELGDDPSSAQRSPVGSSGASRASERVATPAERELLLALADNISVAMESIRVLEELEVRVAERTLELEASNRDLAASRMSRPTT